MVIIDPAVMQRSEARRDLITSVSTFLMRTIAVLNIAELKSTADQVNTGMIVIGSTNVDTGRMMIVGKKNIGNTTVIAMNEIETVTETVTETVIVTVTVTVTATATGVRIAIGRIATMTENGSKTRIPKMSGEQRHCDD